MVIYKITNTINGKIYVGQTIRTIKDRWIEHCTPKSSCTALGRAIQKYGESVFRLEQIDQAQTIEELNKKEIEWIANLNSFGVNGYNLCPGGLGNGGYVFSEESRLKMSKSQTGKVLSLSTRSKMSKARKGLKRPTDAILKTAKANKKKIICIETGIVYDSAVDAEIILKIGRKNIGKVLKGNNKKACGFTFKYLSEVS
jgi:group I intron endonuclease